MDWEPWGPAALDRARKENKLLLISIGYAACHWCHVMEKESFEDEAVAVFMNDHFVSIKVDREERPDVDQVYMEAVQAMTGRGGWPLNCFTLPDGRPVFGGTYFPRDTWIEVLEKLASLWTSEPERLLDYANHLVQGLQESEVIVPAPEVIFVPEELTESLQNWSSSFDLVEGGPARAPKFPLPDNGVFLLRHASFTRDPGLLGYVLLTLDKMAAGGIYDQLGGGFSRYSTDRFWKVPHFEKMLYDNAQLVCLYGEAFRSTRKPRYSQVVEETLAFVTRELAVGPGQWASSLDADSEGEEGRFYVWTMAELTSVLGGDFTEFAREFDLTSGSEWEEGKLILRRNPDQSSSEQNASARHRLMAHRNTRVRPALDDKVLTSWNAMMVKAWVTAWEALDSPEFKLEALAGACFLREKAQRGSGDLWHSVSGGVPGFLEDFAFTIEAFLAVYRLDFDESWLVEAVRLAEFALVHFSDPDSPLLFFTSDQSDALLLRKRDVSDNVIPSSNAVMAEQLFLLGHLVGRPSWIHLAGQMLVTQKSSIRQYGSGASRWMQLQQYLVYPFFEIVVVGPRWEAVMRTLRQANLLNVVWAAGPSASSLGLMKDRGKGSKTLIYLCQDGACNLPVEDPDAVIEIIRKLSFVHPGGGTKEGSAPT